MSKPKASPADRERAAMLASYPATIERNRKEAAGCAERGAWLAVLHLSVTNIGLAKKAGLTAERLQALKDAKMAVDVMLADPGA